jgi:dienelactone hydrolase
MWEPDQFLENLYNQTVKHAKGPYDEDWKMTKRTDFQKLLGEFQPSEDVNLQPTTLEKVEKEDHFRLRVEITMMDSLKAPMYVLIPKQKQNTKLPAVLALHGHGYGSKEIVGLNPDGTENTGSPGIHKNFAVELVRKGMIVVAPEIIGFGDRKLAKDQQTIAPNDSSCFSIASHLLLTGKTLAGLRVFECKRVLDYLQSLDEVDSERIGCMGLSGGGLVAAFSSVVDERIKATVISGYTNTFKGSIMDRKHCLDNYIPGILDLGEMPEIIGLMAPRPLFIESGLEDPLFPVEQVKEALNTLTDVYRDFNAVEAIEYDFFEGGHEISGQQSFAWLYNTLSSNTIVQLKGGARI